ncbi:hypothetical protein [Marivirga sericea]|nr:hypothetical protein [Marivirga sericea]
MNIVKINLFDFMVSGFLSVNNFLMAVYHNSLNLNQIRFKEGKRKPIEDEDPVLLSEGASSFP